MSAAFQAIGVAEHVVRPQEASDAEQRDGCGGVEDHEAAIAVCSIKKTGSRKNVAPTLAYRQSFKLMRAVSPRDIGRCVYEFKKTTSAK